jgi:hypothetical protein
VIQNDAIIRKIAATNNLDFIDLRNDVGGDHQTVDGIHLNAAGYNQWRGGIVPHSLVAWLHQGWRQLERRRGRAPSQHLFCGSSLTSSRRLVRIKTTSGLYPETTPVSPNRGIIR